MCRGAKDIVPMLHSFRNSMHLRVGVRDIVGKDDVQTTTRALSNVAETLLHRTVVHEYLKLVKKLGIPSHSSRTAHAPAAVLPEASPNQTDQLPRSENGCDLVILGLGKLGGEEPNYHSDLDVIFLYEVEGRTRPPAGRTLECTSNQHFFGELGQQVIKVLSKTTAYGRLYEIDPRLRPAGKSGPLAVSFDEFERYYLEGQGQLWERQALLKARPVFGSAASRERVSAIIRRVLQMPWAAEHAQQIREMRYQMQETASPVNLKRGPGGTVDIEFIVQMWQLRHAQTHPEVLVPGTFEALTRLGELGLLPASAAEELKSGYRQLRSVEARLRLMNTTARHDLPSDPSDLARLAYLLNVDSTETLQEICKQTMARNRMRFEQLSRELTS
jgi:glutamate-ammonia-ligase adenylyltransferase